MIERLIICWYVLTMHTYAVFFCNKRMTKQRCYEEKAGKGSPMKVSTIGTVL